MSTPFEIPEPDADCRIIPVFLLVDVSGSMTTKVIENGTQSNLSRIDLVNRNMRLMLEEMGRASSDTTEIDVCIIAFGSDAECIMNLCAADQAPWRDLKAGGATNLAAALRMGKAMVEDRTKMPRSSGRPFFVLVSDGHPYPSEQHWQEELQKFTSEGRTARSFRYALGIGEGTDENMLKQFISGNPDNFLRHANDALGIIEFFEYIKTQTITFSKTNTLPGEQRPQERTGQRTVFSSVSQKPKQAPKRNPFM
jgi:uncharacterized protein YegL